MEAKANSYMLLFRSGASEREMSPEQLQEFTNKWMAWVDRLKEAGKFVDGEPLTPEGRVVSGEGGGIKVSDGPFTESREAIGGFFVLDVASFEEATAIARDCPNLVHGGAVEVRQIADCCPNVKAAREAQEAVASA